MPGQLNYPNYQPHPPTNYLKEGRGSHWSLRQSVHCLMLAILCISGISCEKLGFGDKDKTKNDPSEKPTIPVEVAILGLGPIESVLKASSNLEAESEVNVLARTSNRVKGLLVEEAVRSEQVICYYNLMMIYRPFRFQRPRTKFLNHARNMSDRNPCMRRTSSVIKSSVNLSFSFSSLN